MIYTCRPKKMGIYVNTEQLTASQVKAKLGCAAVINGGLFNGRFSPVAQLRVDGKTLVNENWGTNYGYGWDINVPTMTSNVEQFKNFIGCVCLVKDGKAVKPTYPADMGGARQRTAMGLFSDGRLWLFADTAKGRTPEQLQALALSAGVESCVMLDGGASTQCAFPDFSLRGGRIVHNFIIVWADDAVDTSDDAISTAGSTAGEMKRMKVYLSPSSQTANIYAAGNTNEQEQCRRIALACKAALDRCGFDVIVGDAEIDFTGRVAESNRWGADLHVPIHTNAGGGHGAVVFIYSDGNRTLAQPVYDAINDIARYKNSYGVKLDRNLYEIKRTTGKCVYVEAAFHDNVEEAAWIVDHASDIGKALAKGICKAANVAFVEPEPNVPKTIDERLSALEKWARDRGYIG